ncbi:hypothetical protein E2C01_071846 [Portunus trituberculatus]|uniref:Uncharacterized protein n=1 Tax=Portunus trituberculatus TaxID=210409 RepID=A0A5B7I9I4_PORTR|nr:hypothetical protein [Portunus trituberculatus]
MNSGRGRVQWWCWQLPTPPII